MSGERAAAEGAHSGRAVKGGLIGSKEEATANEGGGRSKGRLQPAVEDSAGHWTRGQAVRGGARGTSTRRAGVAYGISGQIRVL